MRSHAATLLRAQLRAHKDEPTLDAFGCDGWMVIMFLCSLKDFNGHEAKVTASHVRAHGTLVDPPHYSGLRQISAGAYSILMQ